MLQVNYGSHLNNGWYWDRTYSGTVTYQGKKYKVVKGVVKQYINILQNKQLVHTCGQAAYC